MTRQVLIVTVLLLSLEPLNSRPQQTFFSNKHQDFSFPNQGFFNGKNQASSQGFFNGRNQVSSQTKKLRSGPSQPVSGAFFSRVAGPSSGDIAEQTRTQMDSLKNTIIFLARKPEAAPILEKVFAGRNNNTCITNIEEAIEAIETTTKLVENAGNEMNLLVEYVQEFPKVKNMSNVVRQSAKIIGLLDVLIPKLSPPSRTCIPSSTDDLLSMRNLESLLIDLSTKDDLYYTPQVRQVLNNSAGILSKATTFLEKESHFTLKHFCSNDVGHGKDFITAVSNLMGDLADLYTELEGDIAAEDIRKQQVFTKKLLTKIDKIGDLAPVNLHCDIPGSFERVAESMEDLAGLMDDIGLENLCRQLDLEPQDCKPF